MGLKNRKSLPGALTPIPKKKKKRLSESADTSQEIFANKKKSVKDVAKIGTSPKQIVQKKQPVGILPLESGVVPNQISPKKKHGKHNKLNQSQATEKVVPSENLSAKLGVSAMTQRKRHRSLEGTNILSPQIVVPAKKKKPLEATEAKVSMPVKVQPPKAVGGVSTHEKPSVSMVALWPEDDMQTLFSRMLAEIPAEDGVRFLKRQEKLNWNKVAFGDYSGESCKSMWTQIVGRLRKYRVLSEMIQDAQDWIHKPWTAFGRRDTGHPDMPRKPLTAYMYFYCATKSKLLEDNPGLGANDIAKKAGEVFKAMTAEEKKKWEDIANAKRKEYKEKLKIFQQNHPEIPVQKLRKSEEEQPPKPRTPLMIFSEEMTRKLTSQGLSSAEAKKKASLKWHALSEKKKLKYINRAVEEHRKLRDQLKEYMAHHPKAKIRTILNKAELELLLKSAGKPEKPLPNGYAYYMRDIHASNDLKDVPCTDVLKVIAARWKALSQDEKEVYSARWREAKATYEAKYNEYLKSIPEEHREWERLIKAPNKAKKQKLIKEEVVEEEDVDDEEAEEEAAVPKVVFPGEPEKPPLTPYHLFFQSFAKDSGLGPNDAKSFWDLLPESDKHKFVVKHKDVMKKYLGKFQKFLKSLSEENRLLYEKQQELSVRHAVNGDLPASQAKRKSPKQTERVKIEPVSPEASDQSDADEDVDEDAASEPESGNEVASDHESEEELSEASDSDEPEGFKGGNVLINFHPAASSDDENGSESD